MHSGAYFVIKCCNLLICCPPVHLDISATPVNAFLHFPEWLLEVPSDQKWTCCSQLAVRGWRGHEWKQDLFLSRKNESCSVAKICLEAASKSYLLLPWVFAFKDCWLSLWQCLTERMAQKYLNWTKTHQRLLKSQSGTFLLLKVIFIFSTSSYNNRIDQRNSVTDWLIFLNQKSAAPAVSGKKNIWTFYFNLIYNISSKTIFSLYS